MLKGTLTLIPPTSPGFILGRRDMIRMPSFSNIGSGPRAFIPLTFPSFPTTNLIQIFP